MDGIIDKNIKRFEKLVNKSLVVGLGAGYDDEKNEEYLHVQTTTNVDGPQDPYCFSIFKKGNPTSNDVKEARLILYSFADRYNIEVDWDHLSAPTRRGF